MKNKSFNIANMPKYGYINRALGKISKLALVGYEYSAHTVRLKGFFCMRNISMRSHVMAKLERDIFGCAGFLTSLSVNPFQLCHHYLTVIGKASKQSLGAHNHA